jgi:hypothetical protein
LSERERSSETRSSDLKYDITELVDPRFNVAAKVPKSVLATLNK